MLQKSSKMVAAGWLAIAFAGFASITGRCDRIALKSRDKVELAVPFKAQERLLCVPTSASMVLAFYGDEQSPRKLKMLSQGAYFRPSAPFRDYSITPYVKLVRGVRTLGYRWSISDYEMTPDGFSKGLAQLKSDLRAGHPALVDISNRGIGHTIVVAGFDDSLGLIYFVDPAASAPGRLTATYAQFESVWNETAYGGRFRALIHTTRKGGTARPPAS